MIRPLCAIAIAMAAAGTALADPPQINNTSPFGVRRGVATELTISGANLAGNPQLVSPIPFAVEPPPAPNADAANWKLKLTAPPETPVGVYPIRVKTDDGISAPFLFSVGQVPQVAEVEDNSTFEAAKPVPSPVVVEGQSAGNDVDFFKFPGKKGQRIVLDAQCSRIGSGVDPTLRLTTATRGFVAAVDDSPGLMTDARLTAVLPEDGDYVVEISDSRYQGGGRPVYRLLIGAIPVADEVFPLGGKRGEPLALEFRGGTLPEPKAATVPLPATPEIDLAPFQVGGPSLGLADMPFELEAISPLIVGDLPEVREPTDPAAPPLKVAAPAAINGRIDPAGDEDRFAVAVTPGQAYRIRVLAAEYGSALDGQLLVRGDKDAVLASSDDSTSPPLNPAAAGATPLVSPDPSLDFTAPAGLAEMTLSLKDLEGRGGVGYPYRITVEPISPGFDVRLADAAASIPKGGHAAIGVTITRKGYTGPIALSVANPPPGLTVRPGTIADGQGVGVLTLTAAPDAAFGPVDLKIVAEGKGPAGPITRVAERSVIFAQQGMVPTNQRLIPGLYSAPASPGAVTLDVAPEPVEIVQGYPANVTVKVARAAGADGALAITPLPLPPGLAVPAANIAEKAAEGAIPVNSGPEIPLGVTTIALVGKGKFANKDQTFAAPLVSLNVIRPAEVMLATPEVAVKQGETFEVKGKVVRKGPFKEPVVVRLDGLPAGLKAEPVTLAPDATDFTLKVAADAAAAPATAVANLAIAFQVNKKDYTTPPTPVAVKVEAK